MVPGGCLVHLSSISGGSYVGSYVYKVDINGTIHAPGETVSMQMSEVITAWRA